ncbi:hypothetical protein SAMN05216464_102211 [Mucilaginibacter pineti]|uniref:Uncharacterized protein n=1 Tax=Mucilaginibacter pineti TaxID=1391627 RepID=A0A1G6WKF7_9SPHI|nr:hypothetical protein SAMN05216464_102211 [Mucilaginibacter pineti]
MKKTSSFNGFYVNCIRPTETAVFRIIADQQNKSI